MTQILQSPPAADGFAIKRLWFAAGDYRHAASGSLDIRVVQRGSSYAEIDLGAGLSRVFTRPGDVLVTLPDRPTRFKITEDREVTLIAIGAALAAGALSALDGSLSDLLPLSRPPIRSPIIAGLCRIIEKPAPRALVRASIDVILGLLLLQARKSDAARPPVLSQSRLDSIVATIDGDLEHGWQVDELASAAGMNRRAFTTAFKEATGLPAYQFVMQRRTAAAGAVARAHRPAGGTDCRPDRVRSSGASLSGAAAADRQNAWADTPALTARAAHVDLRDRHAGFT